MAAPVGRAPLETLVRQIEDSKNEFRAINRQRNAYSGIAKDLAHQGVVAENQHLAALLNKVENIAVQVQAYQASATLSKLGSTDAGKRAAREVGRLKAKIQASIVTGKQLQATLDPRGLLTQVKDFLVGLVLNRPALEAAVLVAIGVPAATLAASAALNTYVMPSALSAVSTVASAALKHVAPLVGQYCR